MKKTLLLTTFVIALVGFIVSCQKENPLPVPVATETLDNSISERGPGVKRCDRKTVHHSELAGGNGGILYAFQGEWMQELDRIANNCVLPTRLCPEATSSGQTFFCCTSEFSIFEILTAGGFIDGIWPNVTPQGQDYIIQYTLNWAKNNLPPCAPGSTITIYKIDYSLDAFTGTLQFVVRWSCCPSGAVE